MAQTMTIARREAKTQLAGGANTEQVQVRLNQEKLRLTTEAKKRNDALYKRQYALLEIIRQTPDNAQAQHSGQYAEAALPGPVARRGPNPR